MITDEEIKRTAIDNGLLPDGYLPTNPIEKFVDYPELQESLIDFSRAIYQLGRQHQRESDAALMCKLGVLSEDGTVYNTIIANTGELK